MIKKILNIKRVGRFRAFGNGSNDALSFTKNTFIFGSNTHGKSTFAAILRSLHTQNPDYVVGRKTFGETDDQEICIEREDGSKLNFQNGAWSDRISLAIFDSHFISENVFLGEEISDEKQNRIANIILGLDGQTLERKYKAAETACTENSNAKRKITDDFKRSTEAHQVSSFDEFRKIPEDPDIDDKIAKKNKEIEAFNNQEKICGELKKITQKIEIYQGKTFEDDLGTTLEIQQDRIKKHITENLSKEEGATRFFELGLPFIKPKEGSETRSCPFCSQEMGVDAEDLMSAYDQYFSQAYKDLLTKLRDAKAFIKGWGIENFLTERVAELQKLGVTLDVEEEKTKLEEYRKIFEQQLEKKDDLNYKINFHALQVFSEQFDSIETKVEALKKQYCESKNEEALKTLLREKKALELAKKRHESPYKETCKEYDDLEEAFKKTLKPAKDTAFNEKVEYAKKIFEEYEGKINTILSRLGADFQLVDLKPSERQRGSHTLFSLQFFNDSSANVQLDGEDHERNFKNSLSDSDKRMLAFAFFVAQLQNKDDLSEQIVVLDDPMSSFDIDRKTQTLKILRDSLVGKNGTPAKQLIVLTHEDNFFRLIHEYISDDAKYLRVAFQNSIHSSVFVPCDINEEFLKDKYFLEIEKLRDLVSANDEDVSSQDLDLVRKALEHVIKRKYYLLLQDEIKQKKSVSEFVSKLKAEGIYDDEIERKIRDLLPHNSHHDQSNSVCVSSLTPKEIRDIVTNFFEVLKLI